MCLVAARQPKKNPKKEPKKYDISSFELRVFSAVALLRFECKNKILRSNKLFVQNIGKLCLRFKGAQQEVGEQEGHGSGNLCTLQAAVMPSGEATGGVEGFAICANANPFQ